MPGTQRLATHFTEAQSVLAWHAAPLGNPPAPQTPPVQRLEMHCRVWVH